MTVTARKITQLTSDEQTELRPVVDDAEESAAVSVTVDGQSRELDPRTAAAVVDLLARLSTGQRVIVSSVDDLLTTGQAARMLDVSRTYVCRLMDQGRLPVEYRGTHRRVRVSDVMTYLRQQQRDRRVALERVQEISREAGLYDDDF